MRYVVFAVPDHAIDLCHLVYRDPAAGELVAYEVGAGRPDETVLSLLPLCELPFLDHLKKTAIGQIQRRVLAEMRAEAVVRAEGCDPDEVDLAAAPDPSEQPTTVAPLTDVQAEFDRAVAEECRGPGSLWNEDYGQGSADESHDREGTP